MSTTLSQGDHLNAAQCRMARAALQLGVRELAEAAKVSPTTITRLERGEELYPRTLDAIQGALEAAGVEFIEQNGGGPGVRLRSVKPERSE
jgi:transcriptional regulator with XRE-family HTH domain